MKFWIWFFLVLAAGPTLAAPIVVTSGIGQEILWLVGWALLIWLGWWGLARLALGEPWNKIGTVLLVILTVIVVVNFIAAVFFGSPIISFR